MTTSRAERTKKVSAAQAKAKLSELLARVAYGDERYVIERRGKPVAALVSVEDFARLVGDNAPEETDGIWALAGLWSGLLTQAEIDDFLKAVYEARERDRDRPVDLSHLLDE
jgi:prevent-host-death family protein